MTLGVVPVRAGLMMTMVIVAQALTSSVGTAQQQPNHDPAAAKLVFSDIELFWEAYDRAGPGTRAEVLRDEYLKKGSPGLEEFTRERIDNAQSLAAAVEKHPKYYASLRGPSREVPGHEDAIRATFRRLADLYEPAAFPDVYFVIGRMNSGGTLTEKGLLIGVEMYGLAEDTPVDELGNWHRAVVKPVGDIPYIVAHELIHYQQKYPEEGATLLGMAIMEGSADFVGELISGRTANPHLHEYGDPREAELWEEFKGEMDGEDASNWLYQGDRAKGRPADLGYYVGYKICRSYYEDAADKKAAIKAIMEIKDFREFLAASKYESKLARRHR